LNYKYIFIFWELPGKNTKQTEALMRRFKQVLNCAQSSNSLIIYKNLENDKSILEELVVTEYDKTHTFIGVPYSIKYSKNVLLRFCKLMFTSLFLGDITSFWALKAYRLVKNKYHSALFKDTTIVSFYSPRGPILLGFLLKRKWQIEKWVVDFQDPIFMGLRASYKSLCRLWYLFVLNKVTRINQVNLEWANQDGKSLNKKFNVVPHAVPKRLDHSQKKTITKSPHKLKLIFYGSFNSHISDGELLKNALMNQQDYSIEIIYYGTPNNYEKFSDFFNSTNINAVNMGYFNQNEIEKITIEGDAFLFFPWSSKDKTGIPSKFYEMISFHLPVLIVGRDNGSLINVLGSSAAICDTVIKLNVALEKSLYNNDFSSFFLLKNYQTKFVLDNKILDCIVD
jgi:hypothetical protein